MNKKLLSIACMALTLSMFSTPSAADDVTIFGIPAKHLVSGGNVAMTMPLDPKEITMLTISKMGVICQTGGFSKAPDAPDCVKDMFAKNSPRLPVESVTTTATAVSLGGSIVGKNQITLSAESFEFQQLTILGTNGQVTLNFNNPKSLIKSITLDTSNIAITSKGEELHIGSVWGDFTGVPSSNSQLIHILGYSSIKI